MKALLELIRLAEKATPGPWRVLPKFPKSYDDHGYRSVATILKKADGEELHVYAEASNMYQPGKGYVWGDPEADGALLIAARNCIPELKLLLSSSVDKSKLEALVKELRNLERRDVIAERGMGYMIGYHCTYDENGDYLMHHEVSDIADRLQSLINERSGK